MILTRVAYLRQKMSRKAQMLHNYTLSDICKAVIKYLKVYVCIWRLFPRQKRPSRSPKQWVHCFQLEPHNLVKFLLNEIKYLELSSCRDKSEYALCNICEPEFSQYTHICRRYAALFDSDLLTRTRRTIVMHHSASKNISFTICPLQYNTKGYKRSQLQLHTKKISGSPDNK